MPPKSTLPPQASATATTATSSTRPPRRTSKTLQVQDPEYIFEANVDCLGDDSFTPGIKESAYTAMETLLVPLGWVRDGPCLFQKMISVRTGDVGAAEIEFVDSMESVLSSPEMVGVNITWLRVNFNSAAIKFV